MSDCFNTKAGGWVGDAQLRGEGSGHYQPASARGRAVHPEVGPESRCHLLERGNDEESIRNGDLRPSSGSRISPGQSVFGTYSHAELRLNCSVWK